MSQIMAVEYQALATLAGPITSIAIAMLVRVVRAHVRDQRAVAYTARLVAWAEQAIPDKSARYVEVAALLSRYVPSLSSEQIEILIESEVLALKTALGSAAADLKAPVATPQQPGGPNTPTQTMDTPAATTPVSTATSTGTDPATAAFPSAVPATPPAAPYQDPTTQGATGTPFAMHVGQ